MMLFESIRAMRLVKLTEAVAPSGTALNPGFLAAAIIAPKSCPPIANNFCAVSICIQPLNNVWSIFLFAVCA